MEQLYRTLQNTALNNSSIPSPSLSVFVCLEESYDLKRSVISCSSIWLLICRHMCCQLLLFLPLLFPPPLLSLPRSLFTRFGGFQTSVLPKIHRSCTPTFSHPMARLFQILLRTLTNFLPSVSEQNIACFSSVLAIYQSSLLYFYVYFLKVSVSPVKNA